MNPQKQELLEKLKGANNILVTVSANPSVDQLAACIGMTLLLNKLKKHATAVFSGEVPSTLEFLQPEQTIEKNTDSLRDFIISLDKSKADKLRYKVEDQVVRIFITPYRTSITQDDLEFGQGDFNVDVVLCLGVNQQQDLDQAITAHGRILHDAVVVSLQTQPGGELGTINWIEPDASSLSELVSELADTFGKDLIDAQIATALLTGIVAETDRFSNQKTMPETMRISAELMAAGANQQLVATQLETKPEVPEPPTEEPPQDSGEGGTDSSEPPVTTTSDGTLEITHPPEEQQQQDEQPPEQFQLPEPQEDAEPVQPPEEERQEVADLVSDVKQSTFDDSVQEDQPAPEGADSISTLPSSGVDTALPPLPPQEAIPEVAPASRIMLQPPSMGGTLTANSTPETDEDPSDPLVGAPPQDEQPILDHSAPPATLDAPAPEAASEPPAPEPALPEVKPLEAPAPPAQADDPTSPPASDDAAEPPKDEAAGESDGQTLSDIEASVHSAHASDDGQPAAPPLAGLDAARDAVMDAISSGPASGLPQPVAAVGTDGYLNVHELPDIDDAAPAPLAPAPDLTEAAAAHPAPEPSLPSPQAAVITPTEAAKADAAPPPVPPPLPLTDLTKFTAPGQ